MYRLYYLIIISIIVVCPALLKAESEPQWEIGGGLGAGKTPHYFGSNHYYLAAFPYPLLSYRSETLAAQTADPDRYAQLFIIKKETLLLELDVSARLPVESDKLSAKEPPGAQNPKAQIMRETNYTRRGMPSLPFVGFLGTKLSWRPISHLLIDFPVLRGTTLGSGFKYAGSIFSPSVEIRFLGKQRKNAFNLTTIVTHGDKFYNQLYYGVTKKDALPERPEYTPHEGLVAVMIGPTFTWTPKPNLTIVGGYVFHDLHESVIKNSPLVVSTFSSSVGFAMSYIFRKSEELVETW